ncbi:MAG: DUF1475 family protein [Erysipelotrichaceae bacterium]
MKKIIVIGLLGALAMSLVLAYGFIVGDFFVDGAVLLSNPWGLVSLVDLYVGFTLFSLWIWIRESNHLLALVWIVAMMVLGFFTGSVYVVVAAIQSKGDLVKFFLGNQQG